MSRTSSSCNSRIEGLFAKNFSTIGGMGFAALNDTSESPTALIASRLVIVPRFTERWVRSRATRSPVRRSAARAKWYDIPIRRIIGLTRMVAQFVNPVSRGAAARALIAKGLGQTIDLACQPLLVGCSL